MRRSLKAVSAVIGTCAVSGILLFLATELQSQELHQVVSTQSGAANRDLGQAFTWERIDNGVQIRAGEIVRNITFYGPGIVRVNTNNGHSYTSQPSLDVIATPRVDGLNVVEKDPGLVIATPSMQILVKRENGALTFLRPDGSMVTQERRDNPSIVKTVTISGAPTYEVKQTFTLTADESLYGLGQYNQPYMDYRGQEVLMVQTNIGAVVPFLISTRRYGILWDIYSKSIFKDGADGASIWAESAPAGIDYYLVVGASMDGVVAGYRHLTGDAPMFPKQAFGLFMSKERYKTQDELINVTQDFRRHQFPLDYIVQDWQYWGTDHDGYWSGMIWDKERYPDPSAMTKTLHDLHAKLMVSIWPSIGNDTDLAHDLDAHGLRFAPLHWISKQARVYDAYSHEGRAIYFKYIKKGLLDVGVDALWMDGTEVEVGGACHDPAGVEADIKGLGKNALGDFTRYLNPYSLETTRGTYEGQRATSNKRVFTLTRSTWAGQQLYAAVPWSGDTTASWNTLHSQIAGGINIAMSGLPYWTQDTGGFFVNYAGGEHNAEYRELYSRWNQFAIFNPIYRIHGTSINREPYLFEAVDPTTYQSLLQAAQLRYRLLPYIYSMAWMTTSHSYTMMRGLPMDFPDDPAVRKIDDSFMFGPAFLVHPITHAMYHQSPPPATTIPASALETPDGKPGIAVSYFAGRNFERFAGKTIDQKVEYTWPGPPLTQLPPGLESLDNFSGRWEGFLTAPKSGEFGIGIEGDDGFRLWLDGKLVVEDWAFGAVRYHEARLSLSQGQKVAVKIEYFNAAFDRVLRLSWRMPEDLKQMDIDLAKRHDEYSTYLPNGAQWYDFWTNERFNGGQSVTRPFPLDIEPLYVRAGSIVPMGPVVQYATQQPDAPYEIRIYPGANARFTVYEDDNETYDYEKGQYATYELSWNDAARKLTVGPRKGQFPGMMLIRQLKIVLAGKEQSAGSGDSKSSARTVTYQGKPIEVTFAQ